MIVIDDGLTIQRFGPVSFDELFLTFDNSANAAIKLCYCELSPGDIIKLSEGHHLSSSTNVIGSLVTIVQHKEQPHIAYHLCMSSVTQSYVGTSFSTITVSDAIDESVLYLCPVDRFIARIQLLDTGDRQNILVI